MPFKSKAQRRKFAQLLVDGKITDEQYEEWNRSTGGKALPERVADARTGTKKRAAKQSSARKSTKKRSARTSSTRKAGASVASRATKRPARRKSSR